MKELTRNQLKNIKGGNEVEPPNGGGGYKCCWKNTTNCSDCVPGAYPSCVAGAEAKEC